MNPDSIQSMGGKARDAALSDEQKQEIARKAAMARWSGRPMRATHKGNFNEQFGIDVECYVLDDAEKTAVISQRGMGKALGLSSGGSKFKGFLATKTMSALAGPEITSKITQPLKFQWGAGGPEGPPSIVHGYDVTLLIDICRLVTEAESRGENLNTKVVAQAKVILSASAKSGIKGLVYALAGYNPSAEEVITAFKLYVQEEAKKYEKEFPPELYAAWYRLYQVPVPVQGKPWTFKHLTVNHVYYPLANSNGRILELVRAVKAKGGDRRKKLFQFLSEIGSRALSRHLGRLQEIAESSPNKEAYEAKIEERFGGQKQLPLVYE